MTSRSITGIHNLGDIGKAVDIQLMFLSAEDIHAIFRMKKKMLSAFKFFRIMPTKPESMKRDDPYPLHLSQLVPLYIDMIRELI